MKQLDLQDCGAVSGAIAQLSSHNGETVIAVTGDSSLSLGDTTFYSDHVCEGDMCLMVSDGYVRLHEDGISFTAEAIEGGCLYILA